MERQQLPSVVSELCVHSHQAVVVGEVTEVTGELVFGAVHLAKIQEGGQSVDLLPLVGLSSKVVGRESGSAGGSRSEGGDAAVRAGGQARVTWRDLLAGEREKKRENLLWF